MLEINQQRCFSRSKFLIGRFTGNRLWNAPNMKRLPPLRERASQLRQNATWANCRKTKPSSGPDYAAGIRNSFDFAARL